MVNVDGKEFGSYEEAIEYMQKKKAKEERREAFAQKNKLLNSTLCMMEVKICENKKRYLICTLSNASNKDLFPAAKVEELFGQRFFLHSNGVLSERYRTSHVEDKTKVKEFLLNNYDVTKEEYTWVKADYKDMEYDGIFCFNYIRHTEKEELFSQKELENLFRILFE